MRYETSDKQSSYGVKPHIKKGYYPAKLLKVDEFKDKSGTLKVGKFGLQLIFEFAIYDKDENDAPTTPMMFKPNKDAKEEYPVRLSKFVYHMYKKTDKDGNWLNNEFQTAFTQNSAVTKIMKALGWTFTIQGVDPDEFVGQWAELNVDDFDFGEGAEKYTASTINGINKYIGPAVGEVEDVKASEPPAVVEKTLKHIESVVPSEEDPIKKREDNIENLKKLHTDGLLSEEGMNKAIESLKVEIESLKK